MVIIFKIICFPSLLQILLIMFHWQFNYDALLTKRKKHFQLPPIAFLTSYKTIDLPQVSGDMKVVEELKVVEIVKFGR